MAGVSMIAASFGTTIMHLYICVGVIGGTSTIILLSSLTLPVLEYLGQYSSDLSFSPNLAASPLCVCGPMGKDSKSSKAEQGTLPKFSLNFFSFAKLWMLSIGIIHFLLEKRLYIWIYRVECFGKQDVSDRSPASDVHAKCVLLSHVYYSSTLTISASKQHSFPRLLFLNTKQKS